MVQRIGRDHQRQEKTLIARTVARRGSTMIKTDSGSLGGSRIVRTEYGGATGDTIYVTEDGSRWINSNAMNAPVEGATGVRTETIKK